MSYDSLSKRDASWLSQKKSKKNGEPCIGTMARMPAYVDSDGKDRWVQRKRRPPQQLFDPLER